MNNFIELTSVMDSRMKWLIRIEAISFVRRKSPADDAGILLMTGGNIEPAETYTEVLALLGVRPIG